jgi:DNA-binding NtrC family response regulator
MRRDAVSYSEEETERAPVGATFVPLRLDTKRPSVAVAVIEGPDAGRSERLEMDRISIGTHPKNDFVLTDPTVSRFHCELFMDARGLAVSDLESTNGTFVDAVPVREGWVRLESVLRLGSSVLRVSTGKATARRTLSPRTSFGLLTGRSIPMRELFAVLEKLAPSDSTVLLTGETGTGKEITAQSIHDASPRADGPMVVVDCASLAPQLVESELFGHERGAFTDAVRARAGAFEIAHGGTIFLDEIGELPPASQAKILRVLEAREVRRVGSGHVRPVDVRVIAATHRDLRSEVNQGRFREDLYYRLAVIELRLPPLRERLEDLPILAGTLLERLGAARAIDEELIARLSASAWPGNVRQLRNYLERLVALDRDLPPPSSGDLAPPTIHAHLAYEDARRIALDDFERRYLVALVESCDDNVSEAARRAGLNRTYLHKLLRRHGVR